MLIHDLIPTNDRLAKIQRIESNQCPHCDQPDTLIHRLTKCSEGAGIWRWTRFRTAIILRTDPQHTLMEWTVRPSFQFWPPQRHGAILWILAQMLYYRIHLWNQVSPQTKLTSCGVPGGKHITRRVGGKMLGINWRFYKIRHTPTGSATFHCASEHGVPAPGL